MSNFKELLLQQNNSAREPEHSSDSFADAMQGIQPLTQDKIHFGKTNNKQKPYQVANKPLVFS